MVGFAIALPTLRSFFLLGLLMWNGGYVQTGNRFLLSVHPETPIKIPKLKLWTPNNGHLGIQSFSFGRVSGWALLSLTTASLRITKAHNFLKGV